MRPDIIMDDALLMKYLLQEADAHEVQRVEIWLQTSAENPKHFNGLKFIWEESLRLAEGSSKDLEDVAWNRLEGRLNFNPPTPAASKNRYSGYRYQLFLAASVLLICGLGWLMFNYLKTPGVVNVVAKEQVMTQLLPDGSKVILNKNSLISYPNKFTGATRPVKMKGEAFFKVAHNASQPFIISVNGVTVKVLGTSFNIKSRNGKTVIVVATGVVRVSILQNNIVLHQGEYVTIDEHQSKLLKEKNKNKLYDYYRSNELMCDNTPLHELVDVLNEKFKTDIIIVNPALQNRPVTADFTNKSLTEIMEVIAITFKIKVEQQNQQFLLK